MLKPLLYTASSIVLAGGLLVGGPAIAGDTQNIAASSEVTSVKDKDPAEPKARFDVERDCSEIGPAKQSTGVDPDTSEPKGRFDAARNCIDTNAERSASGVTRDYDPGEGEKVPSRLK